MLTHLKTAACAGLIALAAALPAGAEDWQPSGPVKMNVGFGAGGATDALARAIAQSIEEEKGWDVVVENMPGGGGVAMLTRLQAADPDGLTLGVGVTIPVWIQLLRRGDQLPFTLESFDWLSTMGRAGLALVVTDKSSATSFDDLIAQAKEGGVTIATNGPAQELIVRALAGATGSELRALPTKSAGEIVQNLLGGHVDAATLGGEHAEYVDAGTMTVLAGLAPVRDPAAPDVSTVMEMGYPFAIDATFYIAAPAGLSDEAKAALSEAVDNALKSETVGTALATMKMDAENLGPEGTEAMMQNGFAATQAMIEKADAAN